MRAARSVPGPGRRSVLERRLVSTWLSSPGDASAIGRNPATDTAAVGMSHAGSFRGPWRRHLLRRELVSARLSGTERATDTAARGRRANTDTAASGLYDAR